MTDSNNNDVDKLKEGSYDGIQEYDNQLPRWWVWLFVISVIFGFFYLYWFHFSGTGKSLREFYEDERQSLLLDDLVQQNQTKPVTNAELLTLADDEEFLGRGSKVFEEKCVSCHGAHGEGLVGPNLTDNYWIHGNEPVQIVKLINEGVPAKGMIPWKGQIKPEEVHAVAMYIKLKLHGSKVENPKAPEGELIPE